MLSKPEGVFLVGLGYFIVFVLLIRRLLRRRKYYGPAMGASFEELLNNDRRRAIAVVVDGKAEARDPEDRDGNLPDLGVPKC